jgi:cytochrome c biogenesis protein
VKNLGFAAPGLETGHPTDFTTHLAVYQNGQQIADKTIRVNDPLEVAGYTFHQNGFGPAPTIEIRDQAGQPLWSGAVPMTDSVDGLPFAQFAVPGRDVALQMVLQKDANGVGILLILPFRGTLNADGTTTTVGLGPVALAQGEAAVPDGTDFQIGFTGVSQYTLLIAKKDPGAYIAWLAFGLLIVGLLITFWMPRRRIWARLSPGRQLALTVKADRYVDVGREFGRFLDDLVAARVPAAAPSPGAGSVKG